MTTIRLKFTSIAEIEVDEDSCCTESAIEDVEYAIKMALSETVSLGAGAVELGRIVRSVTREE